ncbi:hypothetical protein COW06_00760 [Candidatus Gracilibacteria bacterium CG12_big_fil_rev_8_21_14_0_65_38_15]|nr:MAG: hypothetical protein COW06_00760 [Candidatus Gracilibacteria bacterium CG12_big_fil_rev_8_21_14_0_65_38_15]
MNEGKTNIEQLIFAISKIIDSILEIERRIICRIQYLFGKRVNTILDTSNVSQPTSYEQSSIVQPTVRFQRTEKLSGAVSTEEKKQYRKYREDLVKNQKRSEITNFALREGFIFELLTQVMNGLILSKDKEFDKESVRLKKSSFGTVNHLIFTLRQTIIGSAIPNKEEIKSIRSILGNEKVREALFKAFNEKHPHAHIQALRAPNLLARQSDIIQSLMKSDPKIFHSTLDNLFLHFTQFFPENMDIFLDDDFSKGDSNYKNVVQFSSINPTAVRMKQNSFLWNELLVGETKQGFVFNNAQEFHALRPIDSTFPQITKKNGPQSYSLRKVKVGSYMQELAKKRSFERMLRSTFRTDELRDFNARPEVRIPAAILLDIMDGTPISHKETSFISEVLSNANSIQTLDTSFRKLQIDSRIGDYNLIKYPHVNTDIIVSFFQNKLKGSDIVSSEIVGDDLQNFG